MVKHNRKKESSKAPFLDSSKNIAVSFAALTESTEQGIIFRKILSQGEGRIALYSKRYTGCQRMELELDGSAWQFKYKKQRLMVRKQVQGQMFLLTLPEGIVYWETEIGYIACFWKENYLKKVEMGNYLQGNIECVLCKENEFLGPYKLEKNKKLVMPFTRFLLSIKPFGHAMI